MSKPDRMTGADDTLLRVLDEYGRGLISFTSLIEIASKAMQTQYQIGYADGMESALNKVSNMPEMNRWEQL